MRPHYRMEFPATQILYSFPAGITDYPHKGNAQGGNPERCKAPYQVNTSIRRWLPAIHLAAVRSISKAFQV